MAEVVTGSPLVVIGISAGGVEALTTLVGTLRASFPAPIVIAQYLDPSHPGHLGEMRARLAPLPVVTVADHAVLQAGTIYIVPANRHVRITDHDVTVLPDEAIWPAPTVDLRLSSATAIAEAATRHEASPAANGEWETLNEQPPATIAELNTSNADQAARDADPQPLTMTKETLQHRLLQGIIQAQENERRRIARELHDDIGQSLTALVLAVGVIQEALPESATREQQILEDVTGLAENMMSGLRRVIADLRPPVLDDLGLVPALRRLGSDLQERAGVAVTVHADETSGRLPPAVEITLFRVAQEALANIGKHAHAQVARIMLRREPGRVTLRITDDGQGLPARGVLGSAAPDGATVYREGAHFGLLGMQERVALLNGVFRVKSAPQGGTTVSVELPLDVT
jgi:signal transduction histidine kinase